MPKVFRRGLLGLLGAVAATFALAAPAYAIDTNFRYEINPDHNVGKCVGVEGAGKTDGTRLIQTDCKGSTALEQSFLFLRVGPPTSGLYLIRPRHATNKCLTVEGASLSNSVRIVLSTCQGSKKNQQFRIENDVPDTATSTRLIAEHSKKCLDIQGASNNNGTQLIQFTCGSPLNQSFSLTGS